MRIITVALAVMLSATVGCDDSDAEEIDTSPVVGVLELPVSLRNSDSEPSNAIRLEASPDSLRLDGIEVIPLERGKVPASERSDNQIPKLADAIRNAPARRVVALRWHVNTPWETTTLALATLKAANIHSIAFMVRPPGGSADTGWLAIDQYRVEPGSHDAVEFERPIQRNWDEWTEAWEEAYQGCRRDHYVDCNPKVSHHAEGGLVEIRLFSRGSALKVDFTRFGIEDPEPRAPAQMIEGIAVPPGLAAGEEIPPDPVTHGAFSWRFEAATETELSPVTSAFRPLCGSRQCGVVATGDIDTMTLRLVTFIGAAFPNGTQAPHVMFHIPSS